jgi:aminopeptidase N
MAPYSPVLLLGVAAAVCLFIAAGAALRPPLGRSRWAWAGLLLVAAGLFGVAGQRTYRRLNREQAALTHYYAGIDQLQRGDLKAAEAEFQRSLSLKPGLPQAKEALQKVARQPVAPRRQESVKLQPAAAPLPAAPKAKKGSGETTEPVHPPHEPSPFEIGRYDLGVRLDPAQHALRGVATLAVRSRKDRLTSLVMALSPDFAVDRAFQDGQPLLHHQVNDRLTLDAAVPVTADRETMLRVEYHRSGKGPYLPGGNVLQADGSFLRSEARWYPATGELDFRAPVKVSVDVPAGLTAVSVGRLVGKEKVGGRVVYRFETTHPAAMISLVCGRYVAQYSRVGNSGLQVLVFPRHAGKAAAVLRETTGIVRFYEKLFGSYPYERLTVAEIPLFPGGYGSTTLVMLTSASWEPKRMPHRFLAHEIAHQWWGNSVFPQGPGAGWLAEGFAEYSSYLWAEQAHGGRHALVASVREAGDRYRGVAGKKVEEPIRATDVYDHRGAYDEVIYMKGALVLHALRYTMGDTAFRRLLREFADTHRWGRATIPDFQQAAEKVHGQPLGWFFDEWLGRKGLPALAYSFREETGADGKPVALVRVRQEGEPYRTPLDVALEVQNRVITHRVTLERPTQEFRFPIPGHLSSAGLDPDDWVLQQPPRWEAFTAVTARDPSGNHKDTKSTKG